MQNLEIDSPTPGSSLKTGKTSKTGIWLIRILYIAIFASSIMDLIPSFSSTLSVAEYISMAARFIGAIVIAFFGETFVKRGKPIQATFITVAVAFVALLIMCIVNPIRIAWLLGFIISLLLSLLVVQMLPKAMMGYGVAFCFLGGTVLAITDLFKKTVHYTINVKDPQTILLILITLAIASFLFTLFKKLPVTAKLVLAVAFSSSLLLNILGVVIAGMLKNSANVGSLSIRSFAMSYLLGSQIVIIVFVAIALLLARFITKPLIELANITEKIAKDGDLSIRAAIRSEDEVGMMSNSFNHLIGSLSVMSDIAGNVNDGDLTVEVQPKSDNDKLGLAFKKMVESLRHTVSSVAENAASLNKSAEELSNSSLQTRTATDQITSSMQQLSISSMDQTSAVAKTSSAVDQLAQAIDGVARGAQEQSLSITKASEVTDQINSAIRQVASNANAVTEDSISASKAAQNGSTTVEDTLNGMRKIKDKVGTAAVRIGEMGQRSQEIGAIVETIEEIASQTNLLALNAAIEAARAGEHGKGFAVVADEVRKLAERSSLATKEIAALITGIQSTVEDAVKAMDESSKEVEQGVISANQAGSALSEILSATEAVNKQAAMAAEATARMEQASQELVNAVDSVSQIIEQNTAATEEMAATSGEVAQAIVQIANASEENNAEVEQVSASTEEMSAQVAEVTEAAASLSEMAKALDQLVSQYRV